MTVKELIEQLQNQDAEVCMRTEAGCVLSSIQYVYTVQTGKVMIDEGI